MNVRDFLTVAKGLLLGTTEASWRSAVSRAYYSAFHVARQLLEQVGFAVPRADRAHSHLWLRLSNCGDPTIQLAGRELNNLRGLRNRADYEVDRPMSKDEAAGQVGVAEKIIEYLETAKAEPMRSQIINAMKAYERDVLQDVTWHS
jgi:uncharacterized protein (UPF0332 family)